MGFAGSYESVKRYVRFLEAITPLPFRRMECEAGEEAQVDFGTGAWIIDGDSKRRGHVFRIVLSHSRKGYSEAVYRQDTETFIRCLENAFRAWGGVPKTLVIDNLKAAVTSADWYDPELNPKIIEFARHYGIVILPTRPYTPWHKGKVEGSVKYVKNNALKGRTFKSLAEEFGCKTGSWERFRRVIVKTEYQEKGSNTRFVVTNRAGSTPAEIYDWYVERGEQENRIRELKIDLKAGRLSCHRFTANFFRLLLPSVAYKLMHAFRLTLKNTALEKAQTETIRRRLFKIGALVGESVRRVSFNCSASFVGQPIFEQTFKRMPALGT